ncbi:MAG: PKD domain-containing protein, partial [Bacteroidetes bacterium]|nr:PKD domain-containing protein [Bacteroidota bacterium]
MIRFFGKNIFNFCCRVSVIILLFSLILLSKATVAQLNASFSCDNPSGCNPIVVQFHDLSTGASTNWHWDFGNGSTSSLQNPQTTFMNPGAYTITFIVSNTSGSDTLIKPFYIKVFPSPICKFAASDSTGCKPLTISFTDQSIPLSNVISNWYWDFGDGGYSVLQNPTHTYNASGTYTVYLVVKDANGCQNKYIKSNYIKVNSTTVANFTSSMTDCDAPPNSVNFQNTSTGSGLTYLWDFGDGGASTIKNPIHIYNSLNTFTVRLIVTGSNGCKDTSTQNIVVNSFLTDFSYTVNCNDSVTNFNFQDLSGSSANSWFWDFGDGETSIIKNPSHSYSTLNAGPYSIKLISSNPYGCADSITKVYYPLNANFTPADTFSCISPLTVNFINLSEGTLNYLWNFGDGTTSTLQQPSHTFFIQDSVYNPTFLVKLTLTNIYGCQAEQTKLVKIGKPEADFSSSLVSGCIPLLIQFNNNSHSMDSIVFWSWDFGDGNTSDSQAPSHTYMATGEFTVSLKLTTFQGCKDTIVKTNYIKPAAKPDYIDFTISPVEVCHDTLISADTLCLGTYLFSGISGFNDPAKHISYWYWSLGYYPYSDSIFSDSAYQQNAIFYTGYIPEGLDTVLFVAGANGCNDTLYKRIWNQYPKTGLCHVKKDSSAGSCSDQVACSPPVTLGFYDCSSGNDTVTLFQMEDLQTNQVTNLDPEDTTFITFSKAGRYKINLEFKDNNVRNGNCFDNCNKSYTLTIDSVRHKFSIAPDTLTCNGGTYIFTDSTSSSYGTITERLWNFGDNSTSAMQNPVHTYQNSGTYYIHKKISVEMYYRCGITKDTLKCVYDSYDTLDVEIKIKTNFTISDATTCEGESISFTDNSFSI